MADVEKSIELNDAIFCAQHFKEVVSIAMLLTVVRVVADHRTSARNAMWTSGKRTTGSSECAVPSPFLVRPADVARASSTP